MNQWSASLPICPKIILSLATDADLDVRSFTIRESLSNLFSIHLRFLSSRSDIDFDAIVGRPASFTASRGDGTGSRVWTGVTSHVEQIEVEDPGLSTYQVTLVPKLWLLSQRRNYRMFQQASEPEIVLELLREWGIEPLVELDLGTYKRRKYRVQYGESDFAFFSRM
ncbi:MAG: type VI secretion system tip protein VgrG, partial [Myxococcales bacterium]|nr:type VI secretion system tip protein VgrG [Myxococcales bacterium]